MDADLLDQTLLTIYLKNGPQPGFKILLLISFFLMVFRLVNLDKLAVGASPENILIKIQRSARYLFIKGNLVDQKLIIDVLKNNQVFY